MKLYSNSIFGVTMLNFSRKRAVLSRAFAVMSGWVAVAGIAADRAFASSDADAGTTLQEVVVTARKRSEDAKDVPMSISVLSAEQLGRLGISNNRDLGALFAGVSFNDSNSSNSEFSIRGLTSAGSGSDTSVGLYVDDVFTGDESSMSQRLFDVQSFQILRGPQGTLFGRNTVAGAINIVTRKPDPEFGGQVDATFGNYDLRQYSVAINVPVIDDRLLTRFAYVDRSRQGYLRNLAQAGVLGNDEDGHSARLHVLGRPSDTLDLLLSADDSRDSTCDNMFRLVGGALYAGNTNPDQSSWDGPCLSRRHIQGISLRADQKLGDSTLTVISAYRSRKTEFLTDRDFTALPILSTGLDTDERQMTEEIRLSGTVTDRLKWIAGAFYFHRGYFQDTILQLGPGFLGHGLTDTVHALADLHTKSLAGFGSAEYRISPHWIAETGLRYTWESKNLAYVQTATLPVPGFSAVPAFAEKVSGGEWSPTVTLTFKAAESMSIYARIARGFKSGGFNAGPSSDPDRIKFAPEFLTSYEVGYKADLNRYRLDVSLYYLDYRDIQQSSQDGAGFYISNAAKARSYGAESQFSARVANGVLINASAGFVNARYTSFGANSGHWLPRAPRFTGALSVEIAHPLGDVGKLLLLPEIAYRSENYVDAANTALFRQPSHGDINLRAGFESVRGWNVTAWVRNMSDQRYTLGGFAVAPVLYAVTTSPPRTFGVDVGWKF